MYYLNPYPRLGILVIPTVRVLRCVGARHLKPNADAADDFFSLHLALVLLQFPVS